MHQFLKPTLLVLFLGASLTGGWYLLGNYDLRPETIRDYLLSFGPWAFVVYITLYIVGSLVLFPSSILSIAGGLVFGPLFGTIYTVIAASLGAIFSFGLSRQLGRDFVKPLLRGKIANCDAFIGRHSFSIILFMRLVPIFPFDIINYAAGLCGVKIIGYIGATIIGIIPGTFAYVYLGSSLMDPPYVVVTMLMGTALVGIPLLVKRYMVNRRKLHMESLNVV